jgi:hypothetical protein
MRPIGYYPVFQLPNYCLNPGPLLPLLQHLWQFRYEELYEDSHDVRPLGNLPHTIHTLVTFLAHHDLPLGHRRLLYLGLTLAHATAPTVCAYTPHDVRPWMIMNALRLWLDHDQAFRLDEPSSFAYRGSAVQALDEARLVFAHLVRAQDSEYAAASLGDMLDLCLEGYAIFPGADGRRDLFNWVLLDAVPAAWSGRLPNFIYTMHWPWPPPNSP